MSSRPCHYVPPGPFSSKNTGLNHHPGEHVQSEGQSSQTEKSENPDFASCKQHPILPCTALVKPIVDQLGNLAAQQV